MSKSKSKLTKNDIFNLKDKFAGPKMFWEIIMENMENEQNFLNNIELDIVTRSDEDLRDKIVVFSTDREYRFKIIAQIRKEYNPSKEYLNICELMFDEG